MHLPIRTACLAAACPSERGNASATIRFHTLSGELQVSQNPGADGGLPDLEMALPLSDPVDVPPEGCGDVNGPLAAAACGGLKVGKGCAWDFEHNATMP